METPAELLRRERAALGLSTRDLARLAGVSYPTISRIENGRENPRWETFAKIAAALGVSLSTDHRPVPRIADLAKQWARDSNGDPEPVWVRWRALADQLALNPELVGAAVAPAPQPSGSLLIDNLVAATAEKLADDAGIRRPAWTRLFPALPTPWSAAGTPRRRAQLAAQTPPQFAARNITLPASAIWRDRDQVRA